MEKNIFRVSKNEKKLVWGKEDWIVSGHKSGPSQIEYEGRIYNLGEFYLQHREFFGNHEDLEFPLLVKIIEARSDLSVQVHPDDEYARAKHDSNGKTECWLVMKTNPKNQIIVGQTAKNREELEEAVKEGKVMEIVKYHDVEPDDFFVIYAGTMHAIKGGTKILEIQQSSDVTYRVYDYNRPDANGNLRELHIEDALNVTDFNSNYEKTKRSTSEDQVLTDNKFFTVENLVIDGDRTVITDSNFVLGTVINGELEVNGDVFREEGSFIAKAKTPLVISGTGSLVIAYRKNNTNQ